VKLPTLRHRAAHSRGQALVEFALILPLLALLLVMAIDAGRLFFGRVALENAARIGADFAAGHADAWEGVPDGEELDDQDLYRRRIAQDLQSLNCTLAGDPADPLEDRVPDPNFDPDGDGTEVFVDGSLVEVALVCDFGLLTPLAESALGGPITLDGTAHFAIYRTMNAGIPAGAAPPPPVGCESGEGIVPDLVGLQMQAAHDLWVDEGFTGSYSPAVTNPNKNRVVLTQSLADGECAALSSSVTVTHS
jgi:hypothetical protein